MPIKNYYWHTETILIADDDQYSYLLLSKALSRTGATVLYAKDGKEALDILWSNNTVTAVILDILMPKLSGIEVIKRCKEFLPNTLFFAYTAHEICYNKNLCTEIGFESCMLKPILPIRVLDIMNDVFKARVKHTD